MRRLNTATVRQIKELLDSGVKSARKIGRTLDITHQTANKYVHIIRNGGFEECLEEEAGDSQLFEKCPTCGTKVILPCVACRARSFLAGRALVRSAKF